MGKNKNHNRRKKKLLTVEPKSSTSDGRPCNTLLETEKPTSHRENIQNKRQDLLNEISKINTFNKPETLSHLPLPFTGSTKVKIDLTPVNETKSSFNKMGTTNTLSTATNRADYRECIENEWEDFFNGPSKANTLKNSGSQTLKSPLLIGDKIKPKVDQTTANEDLMKCVPSFNKTFSQTVASSSRKDNSQTLTAKNIPPISNDKMKPKVDQTTANKAIAKWAVASKVGTCSKRNNDKLTEVSKFSNGNFSCSLEAPISNRTRPKVNRPVYPETSKFSTQIISKDSTESLYESLSICEEHYDNFQRTYYLWRKKRLETLKALEKLKNDVHNDQHMFNKTNAAFKELNVFSRKVKMESSREMHPSLLSMSVDFLTSLSTLATDAASGITSFAQAFNIDSYMETFTKIMEDDKEITKPLYAVRSLCLKEYQNVEEVFRKYHSDSFGSTVTKVSNALSLEELWLDLKGEGKDKTCTVIDCVDKFLTVNLNKEAVNKVYHTVQDYTEKNPAALKACASAGKVCYDIYDTWGTKPKESVSQYVSQLANQQLLGHEMAELSELRSVADNEYKLQAKLESDISDAIDALKKEMKEIDDNFINDF